MIKLVILGGEIRVIIIAQHYTNIMILMLQLVISGGEVI